MRATLSDILTTLRRNEAELRRRGVRRAAVFGSVARGEAREGSDVDVLVEIDPDYPMDLLGYADLKIYIGELLGGRADVVNRATLKPLLRERIIREAVDAF